MHDGPPSIAVNASNAELSSRTRLLLARRCRRSAPPAGWPPTASSPPKTSLHHLGMQMCTAKAAASCTAADDSRHWGTDALDGYVHALLLGRGS